MSILCIRNNNTNPYFNLAAEEFLLKNKQEDIFMLWQNKPTVVVGKHQNVYAEINHDFVHEKQINVARRLSGGGAVYHDLGNLNFSYIMTGKNGRMVDFAKYTDDILAVLHSLNVPAERNSRNDLVINGKKISGNAEHVFKNRVLHHGTLLFNSELDVLDEAIKVGEKKYFDKAVQSVRSKVANISSYLNEDINIVDFTDKIMNFALQNYPNAQLYELRDAEKAEIKKLQVEKYGSWEWIYGYSPKYRVEKTILYKNLELSISLGVNKGIIIEANIFCNNHNISELYELCNLLIGKKHDKHILESYFKTQSNNLSEYAEAVIGAVF